MWRGVRISGVARRSAPVVVRHLWELPDGGFEEDDPVVALTFDDGPHPQSTPAVLDALAAAGVAATFFVTGDAASGEPDLTRALADAGHTVGVHGWTHTRFTELTAAALDDELDRCVSLLTATTGAAPRYVRPPYGHINAIATERILVRQLVPVMWSVDPKDWRRPSPDALANHVLEHLAPGRIVILHDGRSDATITVAALPTIIDGAHELGYQFVAL